jgi:anti-sigma factor RsiW
VGTATKEISHFCRFIPDETLRAQVQGTLSADRSREVDAHVRSCPRCAQELGRVAQGELEMFITCADHRQTSRRPRSATYLVMAALAGVGMAFLLRALLG